MRLLRTRIMTIIMARRITRGAMPTHTRMSTPILMTMRMTTPTVTPMADIAPDGPDRRAAFRPIGNGGDRLLTLLQLANASFPTGAFTQSYGFETWIAEDAIADAAEAEQRCRDWLRYGVATGDAVAVVHAYRAALDGDVRLLRELDGLCGAIKLGREAKSASTMTGRALIAATRDVFDLEGIRMYGQMVSSGACAGHHAVVYGIAGAGLALGEDATTSSYLWSALSNLVAVNQRLIPLGQVDAQRIVAGAGALIEHCVDVARSRAIDAMSSTYAALDVAGMRHERLMSRLCIS